MNTILFALKLLMLTGSTEVIVDRVESDYSNIAVVCTDAGCFDMQTVSPARGGLAESQVVSACETVGPRLDGTKVVICAGHVAAYIDTDGSRRANPYYTVAR